MLDTPSKIPYLPEPIAGLERLALNLWWRWDRRARMLLRSIDPAIWSATRHNPVALLRMVDPNRLAQLSRDETFLACYRDVMADLEHALDPGRGWFRERYPELTDACIAYFCAEFGLHNSIPIYSGGLGILAGDHCKSCSDLGVPLVGVGLLYSKGYFDQTLNKEGWQEDADVQFDPRVMPLVRLSAPGDDSHSLTVLPTAGRPVHIGAWMLSVGRVNLYLLDTNLPENDPADRELTYKLYGGGHEHRLKQEWILGVGGVRVLRALGVSPTVWHANEGHAAFMMVERLSELVRAGASLDEGVREVRARSVFTTHTPVPAGHDIFGADLIDGVCADYYESSGLDRNAFLGLGHHPVLDHGAFHMTAAAFRLARHLNAVAKRHGVVTRSLWASLWPGRDPSDVPVTSITNGVHVGSWMSHHYQGLLDELFGPFWEKNPPEGDEWDRILELDDVRVWELHRRLKVTLLDFCRELARRRWTTFWKDATQLVGAGTLLSPEPLTIGFARRFATYKRASLLFRDEKRLQRLLTDRHRPVQLIFAGKAHPADDGGKHILQRVWRATREPEFEGRIAFLEDYDVHVAHRLVQGVDLWLNLPRVPMEACGTSGMKAALNFVPQLSTLDGWWAEGFNGLNGWAIPTPEVDGEEVDAADHEALFTLLEREVAPMFYDRDERGIPVEWVARMKHALIEAGKHFTTGRMVKEYTELFYGPAHGGESEGDDPPVMEPVSPRMEPELSRSA
ncbi:MAG TPA: alpha-glucan family phosphorylase [Longimicrobiales bacterium]|nr:alpha-glucan family phosphorylase [Longimicrobiales bacterium]